MAPPNELPGQGAAVFLDRDGTIMHDSDYCGSPDQVEVYDGASAALRRLREAGFQIFVITNQSGIGRGYFSEAEYRAVAAEMEHQLGAGLIDGTYFCPEVPAPGSLRRKPSPGMIFEAQQDHALNLARSFMIGDKAIDVECGRNAGVRTILVRTGKTKPPGNNGADWEARDLGEAAEIILRHAR